MNKLSNKGRVLAVFATMAFSALSVLGGTAFADRGNVKTSDLGATNTGQDPHLDTACVALNLSNYDSAPSVTFELVAPTAAGSPVAVGANGNGAYSLSDLIASSGVAPAAQGYHVRVDAGGKTKVFWVAAGADGCAGPVSF